MDILNLSYVPYEEKRELLNMIHIYNKMLLEHSYDEYNRMMNLALEINFRYQNLLNIKGTQNQRRYRKMREIKYPSYDALLKRNLTDDATNHMIDQMNNAIVVLGKNFDAGLTQIKKIRYETEEGDYHEMGDLELLTIIKKCDLPSKYKEKLYFMLSNCDEEDKNGKIKEYIQQAVNIPFNKIQFTIPSDIETFCFKFRNILDKRLYGLDKVKEELITTLCCKMFTSNAKYKAIALVGPPGIGKTSIARCIADVFDIPFQQISMNGISNSSDLTGHNYTYIGSQPGMIVKALIKMKCNNGVMFFDEIDKANNSSNGSVAKCLMNI